MARFLKDVIMSIDQGTVPCEGASMKLLYVNAAQLAKGKAGELEDLLDDSSAAQHRLPVLAPAITAARTWAYAPDWPEDNGSDDTEREDVVLTKLDGHGMRTANGSLEHDDRQRERDLKKLKRVRGDFQAQLNADEWCKQF